MKIESKMCKTNECGLVTIYIWLKIKLFLAEVLLEADGSQSLHMVIFSCKQTNKCNFDISNWAGTGFDFCFIEYGIFSLMLPSQEVHYPKCKNKPQFIFCQIFMFVLQ